MALEKNLQKLNKLLSLMDEDTLTKEDFVQAFDKVVAFVNESDTKNRTAIEEAVADMKDAIEKEKEKLATQEQETKATIEAQTKEAFSAFKSRIDDLFEEQAMTLNFIRDKVRNLENGRDGEDADPNEVAEIVANMLTESLLQRIDELEQENEKQQKEIEELKNRPVAKGGGGGVTNARIQQAFKYILKTEEPTGAIDGANTDYTVSQPIFAVLAFSLNGEVIPQLPNYTISGKTISFTTALPAAYSGKDFEVKYI